MLTTLGLIALPVAAAQADALWAGANASPEWAQTTNWNVASTTPPTTNNTAAGVITFPDLGSTSTCVGSCYTSHNGLTGITATGLTFTNTTAGTIYHIDGNGIALSGPITDNSGGGTSEVINIPLALSGGTQTWTIGNGAGTSYNNLSLSPSAAVSGSVPLNVTFGPGSGPAPAGDLFVDGDMELGTVTVSGFGGLHVGASTGSVNGGNGHAVMLTNHAGLIANPGATVGALTSTGGRLILGTGTGNTATTTLGVNGGVTLDSATSTSTLINDNGSTPGTDFSQLSASGSVALNGSLSLSQGQSGGACVALDKGDVATLFTTSGGTLSGTFTSVPDGTIVTLSGPCPGAQVRINYTSNSVIATVVSGTTPTSTSMVAASPSPASTNQPVTLAATVTTNTNGNVAPSGTVAFSANGTAIPGCTSQPVTASGSSGTATCSASFAASSSPESLTATFTGASGSGQAASSSGSGQSLTVDKGSTSTNLAASATSLTAGGGVTYTATVSPGASGAIKPGGTVKFLDGNTAISSCTAQPLSASGTATCTVSYPASGSHSITATYNGDSSFMPSTSGATTVTVHGGTPPPSGHLGGGPGSRLIVIGRTIQFTEKCQSSTACNGSFTLTVTVRGRHHKLTTVRCASGSFKIAANKSGKIRVKLSGACMRMLRARKAHHRLKVLYVTKSQTGQKGQRYQITLVLR